MLFVALLTILHFCCGLFTPYNYFIAKWDIIRGRPKIILFGKPKMSEKEAMFLAPKFGFQYKIAGGCIMSSSKLKGIEAYNRVVNTYLYDINGNGWQTKFDAQVDSFFFSNRRDTITKIIYSIGYIKEMSSYLDSVSHGSRQISVGFLLLKNTRANVWVGEILPDSLIRVFYYFNVNPYTLEANRIHY